MNTPTHMIIGSALWAKQDRPGSLIAAFAGGLAPDLPMIAMVLFATKVTGVPEQDVYGILYFSDGWQRVFAIDHSFLVWGLVLAAGYLLRVFTLTAFAGSGLAHAADPPRRCATAIVALHRLEICEPIFILGSGIFWKYCCAARGAARFRLDNNAGISIATPVGKGVDPGNFGYIPRTDRCDWRISWPARNVMNCSIQ